LKIGPMGCPEASVINDHHSLRNDPQERSSQSNRFIKKIIKYIFMLIIPELRHLF